jgi:hypothetical protein
VRVNALGDPAKEENAAKICAELNLSTFGGHIMTAMAKASWEPKPSLGAKVEHSPKLPKPTDGRSQAHLQAISDLWDRDAHLGAFA